MTNSSVVDLTAVTAFKVTMVTSDAFDLSEITFQ